uniref:Uncharacterized protein n=1 Tax=Panagrolaimus sp. ES5 TaxID=591445 RepID=A0AC34GYE3_9BILA
MFSTAAVKRLDFLASYCVQQNWALPDSVIYHLAKNPKNAKVYQKLVNSCKHFFIKNPIIVVQELYFNWNNEAVLRSYKDYKCINMKTDSYKYWITEKFGNSIFWRNLTPNIVASVIPKLYKQGARILSLAKQNISYNEFLFLSSNVEILSFYNTTVKNDDGSIVPLEKLVEKIFNVKEISFDHDLPLYITTDTVKELLKLDHFSKLEKFDMLNIPEIFDIDTFFIYLKTNTFTKLKLHFSDTISVGYKNRIEAIIDEILETENHKYGVCLDIKFNGLADEKWMKLLCLSLSKNK